MSLLRSTFNFGAMTLVSRVLGFVRDIVLARSFGANAATDAFFVAFKIPNFLRRLFAEGSFSLAFVPVLAEYREKGDQAALKSLIDATAGVLLSVLLVITAVGMMGAPWVVRVFAPGFADNTEQLALAADMLRVTFPYLLFIALTALAGGILNTLGRFALPALTPALLNISLIVAALGFSSFFAEPVKALAWGVLVAGILQLLVQLPLLARHGVLPRPVAQFSHPGVRRILRLMVPTLFGSSVAQINLLLDVLLASLLISGSLSWLYYADRLMEFPLGLFGVALSTVILPSLAGL
ncbi:MAG: murein biosynthesis integral membrane protein MurJ, partial [Wenzhouxiangella sp.]|nr:murein biosynthesis integral membrane protein MurJ [Wenzhouxiangella sp.]